MFDLPEMDGVRLQLIQDQLTPKDAAALQEARLSLGVAAYQATLIRAVVPHATMPFPVVPDDMNKESI
jgi:hypothetical protein